MSLDELVKLYFDRVHATQDLWAVYITVLLGLVAFWGAIDSKPKSMIAAAFVSVGFMSFAVVNDGAIERAQYAQDRVKDIVAHYTDTAPGRLIADEALRETLTTIDNIPIIWSVRRFHIAGDVGLLIAIWWLTLYPIKHKSRHRARAVTTSP